MNSKFLGTHILIDYFECNSEILNNKAFINAALLEAARLSNATIVTDVFHTFNPHGISGVVVIAESHIAVHTWPEYACAAVDVFSCGSTMKPEVIEGFLKNAFQARTCESRVVERGRMTP